MYLYVWNKEKKSASIRMYKRTLIWTGSAKSFFCVQILEQKIMAQASDSNLPFKHYQLIPYQFLNLKPQMISELKRFYFLV